MSNDLSIKNTINFENLKTVFFDNDNWKKKKKLKTKLVVDNNTLTIANNSKKINYITFLEHNTSFSKFSTGTKNISLSGEYTINVNSIKSGSIRVIFYLLEYDIELNKIKTNKISLQGRTVIKTSAKTKYARIAIRIEGKGELQIKDINIVNYINNASDVESMPTPKLAELKIACILDEFSMASFDDVVNLITFSPYNWQTVLHNNKPDLLLIESAWKGNNGTWQYEVGNYNNNNKNARLKELIAWCKRNRVPTVFWNKEDPVHFEKFTNTASLVDYVFTTDSDSIPRYKKLLNHNRVDFLQFAANPIIHNPISLLKEKKKNICFAGSYYANRHADRKMDMDQLLNISNEFGLHIYDRNYTVNQTNNESHFRFPEHLQQNVIGTLKYNDMDKAYKEYRLTMNVNSVKYSPTMFSRRVFESLATGTPVISSYATGIKKIFNNIVPLLEDEKNFRNEISKLMNDDRYYRSVSLMGMREIYNNHTYEDRMIKILNKFKINFLQNDYSVTLLFKVNEKSEVQKAMDIIENQTYKNVKVIFLLNFTEEADEILNNYNNNIISSYLIDYAYKYESLDKIVTTDFLIQMDNTNKYGSYFIEDLIHASRFSTADIIGKSRVDGWNSDTAYLPGEYEFVDNILFETALFKVDVIKNVQIDKFVNDHENLLLYLFKEKGCRIFSSDRFNFNEV